MLLLTMKGFNEETWRIFASSVNSNYANFNSAEHAPSANHHH